MHHGTHIGISEHYIYQEHLRVLQRGAEECADFDISGPELDAALDYLEAISTSTWGFTLYREGPPKCGRPPESQLGLFRQSPCSTIVYHRSREIQLKQQMS